MLTVSRHAIENTMWDGRVIALIPSEDGESIMLTLEKAEDIDADIED